MQQTLILLKPDCVHRRLIGNIIQRFEHKGLRLVAMKLVRAGRDLAAKHYAVHQGKPFYESLLQFVPDRPGHDRRYAIDIARIRREIGWSPEESFSSGLRKTIRWYLDHSDWVEGVTSGAYRYMRHPIYTGLFLANLGVALRAYSPRNALVLGLGIFWFLIKSIVEENFLRADPQYAVYLRQVRARWIPFVV